LYLRECDKSRLRSVGHFSESASGGRRRNLRYEFQPQSESYRPTALCGGGGSARNPPAASPGCGSRGRG